MQILRAHNRLATPWKNGAGVTYEICVSPLGADITNFDWRISQADITKDGDFSHFEGVERTLCLLDGEIELTINDQDTVRLNSHSAPLVFDGEDRVSAKLITRSAKDLNIMTRKGVANAIVTSHSINDGCEVVGNSHDVFIFALAEIELTNHGIKLARFDMLYLSRSESVDLSASAKDGYIKIEIINRL